MMDGDLAYLRAAHDSGAVVPFIGSGLSAAAAGLPSWPDLLTLGLRYATEQCGAEAADARLAHLAVAAAGGDLIGAFDYLQDVLGYGSDKSQFEAFLAEVFHKPAVTSTALLDALRYLSPRRVLTTNYDLLLEEFDIAGPESVTWRQVSEIRTLFRVGSGVVHLHGRWDRVDSVVLSRRDYDRIVKDKLARTIASSIFNSGVLVFIGTSLDGTHDPHLAGLLGEFEALSDSLRGEPAPHIMLVRGSVSGKEVAKLLKQGIRAVGYGDDYEDLPAFLRSIGETERVSVKARDVERLLTSIARAEELDEALRMIGRWIESDIYGTRETRVAFSQKVQEGSGHLLRQRAVKPFNSSGNPHNYPLSIAAMSLVEGRIIEWPGGRNDPIRFAWLDRLGKLGDLDRRIASTELDESPELKRYLNLADVRARWSNRSLHLGGIFQDWATDQPRNPYSQFISLPVPLLEQVGTREKPPEYGVFNIDTQSVAPLLDRTTTALLRLASAAAVEAFRRFSPDVTARSVSPSGRTSDTPRTVDDR